MLTGNLNYYLKLDYNRPTIYRPLKLSREAQSLLFYSQLGPRAIL